MTSSLRFSTALCTTLPLEEILAEFNRRNEIKFLRKKDRVVYIFHCFEVDGNGHKTDMGYELLSPLMAGDEMMLLPYPLNEDLFSSIDLDNDRDNRKQLEVITKFLKKKEITTIFTGLLPDDGYFMGTKYAIENEDNDSRICWNPIYQGTRDYITHKGLRLIYYGNLPNTTSNNYLN